jgi:EMC6
MIDPMADLGSSGGDAANEADAKDVFDPNALGQNMQRIDKVRSFMGIISGCVAGIFGFTGLEGLGTYTDAYCCLYPR